MSTILDALAKAKQEKERGGIAHPRVMIKPFQPRGKGRGLWILLLATATALAGTLLVVLIYSHWTEHVLVALGFGKKQQVSTIAASKPSAPSLAGKTTQQKPVDAQPQGFLEILMKSKEMGASGKAKPVFSSAAVPGHASKDDVSKKTMPPFLQNLKKLDSTSQAATEKPAPTRPAENPFARLLKQQQQTSSRKSRSTPPALASSKDIQDKIKSDLGPRELFNKGVDLEKAGKLQLAIAAYRKAIASDKKFARAYINLGNLYLNHRKKPRQAIFMYRQALENSPENPKAHNNLGVAYLALEQFDRAETEFLKAAKLDKGFVEPVYNLACLFAQKGDEATAFSWLKKAHAINGEEIIRWSMKDPDLENLHKFPAYQDFLKTIKAARENTGR